MEFYSRCKPIIEILDTKINIGLVLYVRWWTGQLWARFMSSRSNTSIICIANLIIAKHKCSLTSVSVWDRATWLSTGMSSYVNMLFPVVLVKDYGSIRILRANICVYVVNSKIQEVFKLTGRRGLTRSRFVNSIKSKLSSIWVHDEISRSRLTKYKIEISSFPHAVVHFMINMHIYTYYLAHLKLPSRLCLDSPHHLAEHGIILRVSILKDIFCVYSWSALFKELIKRKKVSYHQLVKRQLW